MPETGRDRGYSLAVLRVLNGDGSVSGIAEGLRRLLSATQTIQSRWADVPNHKFVFIGDGPHAQRAEKQSHPQTIGQNSASRQPTNRRTYGVDGGCGPSLYFIVGIAYKSTVQLEMRYVPPFVLCCAEEQ